MKMDSILVRSGFSADSDMAEEGRNEARESRIKTVIQLVLSEKLAENRWVKVVLIMLILAGQVAALTTEVVRVFVPLSFHETDTAIEAGPTAKLVQAGVVTRTMVLSGAFPEDLVKAVALPCRLPSNHSSYDVAEANLAVLYGLSIGCSREGALVEVVIDCEAMKVPKLLDLKSEQVLRMTVESIRRTLRVYYRDNEDELFQCHLTFLGLSAEQSAALQELETSFQVGAMEEPSLRELEEQSVIESQ